LGGGKVVDRKSVASFMPNACPSCGAPLNGTATQCWLCREHAEGAASNINPYASPPPLARLPVRNQFSLATLFLIMTLAAVALGALMVAPGLGTTVIVIAVPALVRSVIAGRRRLEGGETPTIATKIFDFVASAAIIWAISVAATIAFFVTCTAVALPTWSLSQREETALYIGLGAGLAMGAVITTWLLWITRPKSRASAQ
jgi:hypothetical protein